MQDCGLIVLLWDGANLLTELNRIYRTELSDMHKS